MGEAVRIYPANLTKEEHELHHQFTAVLRNFPRNTKNTDYMRMFSNFNAASMGIPRTINNSIKPWIYINFRSEELMQAAIEISPIVNGRQLVWEQPDNVRNFCPRCSNPGHKAKDCDDIRSRGRKLTPKALLDVYRKHGIVNAATKQADKQLKQQQQCASRARSQSRSRFRRPQVEFTPTTTQIDNELSAESYADALNNGPNGLNNSAHAPNNRSNKGKAMASNANTKQLSISSTNEIVTFINTIEHKLNHLTKRMDQWKVTLDSIDSRFENIDKHLNIAPPPLNTPAAPTNTVPPSPPNATPPRPKRTNTAVPSKPPQNLNSRPNNTPTPVNIPPVASTSTVANNNNNNIPTVQGLANEFNTMQEDVSSLKSMLSNLTSMLQNAIGQPQESTPSSIN